MFVLLILHCNNYKKPVESLVRNKVRAGHFTEVLLQTTFTGHAQVSEIYREPRPKQKVRTSLDAVEIIVKQYQNVLQFSLHLGEKFHTNFELKLYSLVAVCLKAHVNYQRTF